MKIVHYNNENLDELLKSGVVILDFYANWCGPCQILSEDLETLANDRSDGLIIKIDVDKYPDIANKYSVMSIPNVYIYKDNKQIEHFIGYKTSEEINDLIK